MRSVRSLLLAATLLVSSTNARSFPSRFSRQDDVQRRLPPSPAPPANAPRPPTTGAPTPPSPPGKSGDGLTPTNATYYNGAQTPGADPMTIYDAASGYYYAYSTEGMDEGWYFAIYKSPDLITWQKIPGGAIKAPANPPPTTMPTTMTSNSTNSKRTASELTWARDWQWAPEVYHNDKTGWYFIFFAGRLRFDLAAQYFRYSAFEEPSKIGVARSRSPEGPFEQIEDKPIDYFPFDPVYHDVNLIMDDTQLRPPATQQEGKTAPQGTYIPTIDPNLFFADDGRIYWYTSRNAYRNWNWDQHGLNKYIEESNIIGVELKRDWWDDPTASTMPEIVDSQVNANLANAQPLPANISSYNGTGTEIKEPPRKDGFQTLISYNPDPQEWENYHVNDYAKSNGTMKDRRWSEGSTLIERKGVDGKPIYFITYSANNYVASMYGIGYASGSSPLGPFKKSSANPVLAQLPDADPPAYSVGHGSIVATVPPKSGLNGAMWGAQNVTHSTPQGSELFYVHHGRNSTTAARSLYTTRIGLDATKDPNNALRMHLTTQDQPIAKNVAPYSISLATSKDNAGKPPSSADAKPGKPKQPCVKAAENGTVTLYANAFSQTGARFDLKNGQNRIAAHFEPTDAGEVTSSNNGTIVGRTKAAKGKGLKAGPAGKKGSIVAVYQRLLLDGNWTTVAQGSPLQIVSAEDDVC